VTRTIAGEDSILADYITRAQFAAQFGITERTAERWERLREGPPVTHVGRKVLYRKDSVLSWLKSREIKMPRSRCA
jgi:hypothetical protein